MSDQGLTRFSLKTKVLCVFVQLLVDSNAHVTRHSLAADEELLYLSGAIVHWVDVVHFKAQSRGYLSSCLSAYYSEEDLVGLRRLIWLYDELPATDSSGLYSQAFQEIQQIVHFCSSREISTLNPQYQPLVGLLTFINDRILREP